MRLKSVVVACRKRTSIKVLKSVLKYQVADACCRRSDGGC